MNLKVTRMSTDSKNNAKGVSLDGSISSDSQNDTSVQASAATRWLSDRFHINTMAAKPEEDVFDVNQWPSLPPITTSIGINKQRFLFSSPIARSMPQKQQQEDVAKNLAEEQAVAQDDVDMGENEVIAASFIETESPGQDTVMGEVYQDEEAIEPSSPRPGSVSNDEVEPSQSTSLEIQREGHKSNGTMFNKVKAGLGSAKANSPQKNTKAQSSNLTPFRRMIQNATKKSTTTNKDEEDDVDDVEGITRFAPITLQEKRRRQAKRAEQLKFWKVREEREAREARRVGRRDLLEGRSGNAKRGGSAEPTTSTSATLRKAVKFNLKRNRVIQFEDRETDDRSP
ncbi:hypothetical protein K450DRAFT_229040 [Umbelopsis ramanniana AG]|uniref:Uncharacterized protein n=1 Tax=Umbelopsis ramanniana AG TaxID=1314678 RepID=A0AAD5HHE3_UMBRA|nr:uncharacterized protein K450DRAFT_229040 [Umbelopsis ramanniana AG]KAI8582108.1 hypothetical protein K450DRAFT_229040 [Umbelopsis ramanniana AG]